MPAALSYPGVYVEEIPSGVRTITGVPTSVAAFIGRALRGPVNEPFVINSFGDFDRTFGGQRVAYPMSYAINDFFLNGGGQAVVVRLWLVGAAGGTGIATLAPGGMNLVAASPGSWADQVKVMGSLLKLPSFRIRPLWRLISST